jgi:hypothetical protein
MRFIRAIAFVAALSICSAAFADESRCPKWEAGARYPWQSDKILPGDHFAWLILDVDRTGYAFRCKLADNNYVDPEDRFWLCQHYTDRWRGPPAASSDPDTRTLKRYSLIAGYDHHYADKRARTAWFRDHPEERPECYPEPTRPDRLG